VGSTSASERMSPSERLARSTIRFRYPIVLVAIVLAIVCTFPVYDLIRLHVKTNYFSLLPEDQPSIVTLFDVIETTGGFGELMVVVESPDRQANVRFVEELYAAVDELDWVNYAEYGVDAAFFERNAMLYIETTDLETIEQRLRDRYEYEVGRLHPLFIDLLDEGPPPIDFSSWRSTPLGSPERSRNRGAISASSLQRPPPSTPPHSILR